MESIEKSMKNLMPDDIDSLDGKEKTDATPENMKKIDDVIRSSTTNSSGSMSDDSNQPKTSHQNYVNENFNVGVRDTVEQIKTGVENNELKIIEDESSLNSTKYEKYSSQQSFAFTIDFGNTNTTSNNVESLTTNSKYKIMLERFQNRHKRGSSMSSTFNNTENIEENHRNLSSSSTSTSNTPRIMSAQTSRQPRKSMNYIDTEAGKVKLRLRERSTSGVRDSNKRHSWSPRSSTIEPLNFSTEQHPKQTIIKIKSSPLTQPHSHSNKMYNNNIIQNAVSAATAAAASYLDNSKMKNSSSSMNFSEELKDSSTPRTEFAPRSTAMQMALDKIDFLCPQPPLDNYIISNNNNKVGGGHIDGDNVSETGTYTLDGDNYTEEQKDLMNIDKSSNSGIENLINLRPKHMKSLTQRPTELSIHSTSPRSQDNSRKNTLDLEYYHDSPSNSKPKISYLEKIKSRVRNFTKSPDKIEKYQNNLSNDKGSVTSITTSGILAKKLSLDPHPKLNRKNSLTTSQIDSTEYIGDDILKKPSQLSNPTYSSGGFTDHQKAEYRLFTKQSDSDNLSETEPPFTPDSPQRDITTKFTDTTTTTGLKTAETKFDWIQEWAREARAQSVSATGNPELIKSRNNAAMSRSYNCEAAEENLNIFGENHLHNLIYRNKQIDNIKTNSPSSYEFSSDPNVCKAYLNDLIITNRPPLSPSKIPSPIPSLGRARSNSKVRASLQDLSPSGQNSSDTDIYLQKTQAAISNLSQTLSLNSVNSPRRGNSGQRYSTEELLYNNPDNNIQSHGIHRRNLSLDYRIQSNNPSNTKFTLPNNLNDYRSPKSRINSLESTNNLQQLYFKSPRTEIINNRYIDQTSQSIKQPSQLSSPLRRSSSFSVKPLSGGNVGNTNTIGVGSGYRAAGGGGGNLNKINLVFAQKCANQQQTPTNLRYNSSSSYQSTPKYSIQKSASSNSFCKMYSDYDENVAYYINDEDDLAYSNEIENVTGIEYNNGSGQQSVEVPLSNTRYNKALLMRIEKSKQKVAGNNAAAIHSKVIPPGGGTVACTNTPELPRRTIQNIQRASMRQSVPRESSLNRLKVDAPNSLASAKKELLQQPTNERKSFAATPRYLDISKYKTNQGATFLKKDETKVTLKSEIIKRSPSSASVSLNRTDPSRSSSRSIKSAKPGGSRPSSASTKRDQSATKQKEADLAMWRRRATYDPMKAAAEDKRKKEEAKKLVKSSESSSVLRSQSFNCGVGEIHTKFNLRRNSQNQADEYDNCWPPTISSDEDNEDDDQLHLSSSTNTTN